MAGNSNGLGHGCIGNFINGNIKDAKRQAASLTVDILLVAGQECGLSPTKADAVAKFLKNKGVTWQQACDTE